MLHEIHHTIARVLEERAIDRRTCFTAVSALPPSGQTIVIECSDREVLEDIRGRLAGRLPEGSAALAFVALPRSGPDAEKVVIAAASVVDVRRDPSHSAELTTQLIRGDVVEPLKSEGEWTLVRLDDGYVGWVRSWHLTALSKDEHERFNGAAGHRIRENVVVMRSGPSAASPPVTDAVTGTPAAAEPCGKRGWRRVSLPDGNTGFLPSASLEKRRAAPAAGWTPAALRRSLAAVALRFLGVPYVWGGTTPKGFDCSGLTQRVFRLHGIVIPRDSDMQARFGRVTAPPDARSLHAGDLLFFGKDPDRITHVALFLGEGRYIHARGHVRLNSVVASDAHFDPELAGEWRLTVDPLSS